MIDTTKYTEPIQLTNFVDIYHRSSFLEQQREELVTEVERLQSLNKTLRDITISMRCCFICKHYDGDGSLICRIDPASMIPYMADFKCDKWEMQE